MLIPESYAQVNLIWSGSGLPQGAQVTFGVFNSTDLDAATVATTCLAAWADADVMVGLSSQVVIDRVLAKLGPNLTGPAAEVPASLAGSDSTQQVPPNTSMLVRKNTDVGGRQGRGRMFIPGVPESVSEGTGALSPAAVTSYQAAFSEFLTNLAGADLPMVLLHSEGSSDTLPYTVTSLAVMPTLATQRRRLRG